MGRLHQENGGRITSSFLANGGIWQLGTRQVTINPSAISGSGQTSGLPSGPVNVIPPGYSGGAFQVYLDNSTHGGGWLLAWVVTNTSGVRTEWHQSDFGGTNYFTAINVLYAGTTAALNKINAKNPLFDYWPFEDMMILENHNGTVGSKAYRLNTINTFRGRFQATNNTTYTNQVSSILGESGSFSTFTTSTLMFNYDLANDGARLAATAASSEATGGIASRVDGSQVGSHLWAGNITRSDAGRIYSSVGTTADHTAWIFVR